MRSLWIPVADAHEVAYVLLALPEDTFILEAEVDAEHTGQAIHVLVPGPQAERFRINKRDLGSWDWAFMELEDAKDRTLGF